MDRMIAGEPWIWTSGQNRKTGFRNPVCRSRQMKFSVSGMQAEEQNQVRGVFCAKADKAQDHAARHGGEVRRRHVDPG